MSRTSGKGDADGLGSNFASGSVQRKIDEFPTSESILSTDISTEMVSSRLSSTELLNVVVARTPANRISSPTISPLAWELHHSGKHENRHLNKDYYCGTSPINVTISSPEDLTTLSSVETDDQLLRTKSNALIFDNPAKPTNVNDDSQLPGLVGRHSSQPRSRHLSSIAHIITP
ncbi:unnamed protein product [Protopolystoma xenopodis]|uniref:Uncharacterized protein n=1 Tax=Protopolystoma xenopodis TaxID=117903 RepID=A0A448X5D9_9PLAT|nr:unnamed protein product [Protopolystoma xenopodis]